MWAYMKFSKLNSNIAFEKMFIVRKVFIGPPNYSSS